MVKKMGTAPSCNFKGKRYDLPFLILPSKTFNFRFAFLYGYCDSDGLQHHSSDVFSHGASISDGIGGVGALYLSISYGLVESSHFFFTMSTGLPDLLPAWNRGSHVWDSEIGWRWELKITIFLKE